MKTGPQIRKDVQAILDSSPPNLSTKLAEHIIRIRREAFAAGFEGKPFLYPTRTKKEARALSDGTLKP